jgi:hypothetical protein
MSVARLPVVLLTAIVLAFAAAGCGGGDDGGNGDSASSAAEPSVWAASVCGALARFVTFLEDAEESSGEMVDKVEEAGPPNVSQGEAIQNDLVGTLGDVQQSFSQAVDKANELSTSSLQSFSSGVSKLSEDVQDHLATTGGEFNSLSDRYQSPELDDATDGEPACQQFSSG